MDEEKLLKELTAIREKLAEIEEALITRLHNNPNPVSYKCEKVLAETPKCWDFSGIRRWAACFAWDLMEKEKIGWREAIGRAWDEARKKCVWD